MNTERRNRHHGIPPRARTASPGGTNCDHESAYAFEKAGAKTERLHVNALLDNPIRVSDYQILCLPGGFSYGDDISAGRISANQIRNRLFGGCQRVQSRRQRLIWGSATGSRSSSSRVDSPRQARRARGNAGEQRFGQVRSPLGSWQFAVRSAFSCRISTS